MCVLQWVKRVKNTNRTLPPFLQPLAVQKRPSSWTFPARTPAQKPECTTPDTRNKTESKSWFVTMSLIEEILSNFKILIWVKHSNYFNHTEDWTSLWYWSYRHAGAALGEVDHSRVELVFEEVSMCHHSPSQCQTGGSHQGWSYHFGLSCRYCRGETDGGKEDVGCMWKQADVAEQHAKKVSYLSAMHVKFTQTDMFTKQLHIFKSSKNKFESLDSLVSHG